jgi:hypothetical protein
VSATISRVDRKLIITEPKTARSRRTVPMPSAVGRRVDAPQAPH